jgi:hypothetical protein
MDSFDFIKWREMHFGLDRRGAAAALGIALNSLRAYETGKAIPAWVPLACNALAAGIGPWKLPAELTAEKKRNPNLKPSVLPVGKKIPKKNLHQEKNSDDANKEKAAT